MSSNNEFPYTYYIAYNFVHHGRSGFGATSMSVRNPLTTFALINEVGEYIRAKNDFTGVVVMNFQLLTAPADALTAHGFSIAQS